MSVIQGQDYLFDFFFPNMLSSQHYHGKEGSSEVRVRFEFLILVKTDLLMLHWIFEIWYCPFEFYKTTRRWALWQNGALQLNSHLTDFTLLCKRLSKKLFLLESYPEYKGIKKAHYVYRIIDQLRKHVLVSLWKALELSEVYIYANQYNAIFNSKVSLFAMKVYQDKFLKHNEKR